MSPAFTGNRGTPRSRVTLRPSPKMIVYSRRHSSTADGINPGLGYEPAAVLGVKRRGAGTCSPARLGWCRGRRGPARPACRGASSSVSGRPSTSAWSRCDARSPGRGFGLTPPLGHRFDPVRPDVDEGPGHRLLLVQVGEANPLKNASTSGTPGDRHRPQGRNRAGTRKTSVGNRGTAKSAMESRTRRSAPRSTTRRRQRAVASDAYPTGHRTPARTRGSGSGGT